MSTPRAGAAATVEIRPFTPADGAAVEALWAEAFPEGPSHNASAEMIARKLTVQPELFLVAVQDARVVGSVMAGFDGVRGWIHRLAVLESTRRQGVASAWASDSRSAAARVAPPAMSRVNVGSV